MAGAGQGAGDLGHEVGAERGGRHRRVLRRVGHLRLDLLLHHLARANQVDRAGGFAAGDLQRPLHELLDVAPGADLVVILGVVAQDAALVVHVLDPVDELVPAARQLALDRERGGAGEDQHRNPAPGGVVDRAAQVLGAGVHMHQHSLGFPGHRGVGVRRAEGHGLVRADDQFRQVRAMAFRPGLGERLDQARMVAAEVGEHVADSGFGQRLQERRARAVVTVPHGGQSSGVSSGPRPARSSRARPA